MNTWPGLFGIIAAMRVMYGMVTVFIFIVTIMTGSRFLMVEQRNNGIYKSLGFTDRQLRFSFALRFCMTAAVGSILGLALVAIFMTRWFPPL